MIAAGQIGAFGGAVTTSETPVIQIDATYGITDDLETFSAGTGSATAADGLFACATSTGVGDYGVIRSRRDARYRPGQGMTSRFTASFTAGVANSLQVAGPFTAENALQFGYNGTSFGVLRRTGGALEIRRLTCTVGAGGAENVTIKLDGADTVVACTTGNTAHLAWQLARATYTGWSVSHVGSTVTWVASAVGAKAGAFSIASTGTATGTFATVRVGATPSDSWTAQTAWNGDKMDGTGLSGMVLDKSKLNIYQIRYHWLGTGIIEYMMEAQDGKVYVVHTDRLPNTLTAPSMRNPSMHIGWVAASLGSSTALTVKGASACTSVEGPVEKMRNPRSYTAVKAAIGATETAVLSIRNRNVFGDTLNFREVYLAYMSIASNGTGAAPVTIYLRKNASLPGSGGAADESLWTHIDSTNSCVSWDTTADTVSGGTLLASFAVQKDGSFSSDMSDIGISLHTLDVLTISASTSSGSTEIAAAITWYED